VKDKYFELFRGSQGGKGLEGNEGMEER